MKKILFAAVLMATVALGGVLGYSFWRAQTPEGFFEAGKKYYDEKKYPEATLSFLNAIRKDPRHRDSRYFLALSQLNQQDIQSAADQLGELLKIYPDDLEANIQLGRLYLISAVAQADPALFRQVQEIAKKILSKEPQNVAAVMLSAHASAGLKDVNQAVALFKKALSLDPKNSEAYVGLGTTMALQKNYAEAENAILKAREVNPKDRAALLAVGDYYRSVGDFQRAEAAFKDAVSQYPSDKLVYGQLADFYTRAGRFNQAEEVLRAAQAANSNDPTPTIALVNAYLARNLGAEARKLLLESRQKFPASLELSTLLATDLLQDRAEEAKKEIDLILKSHPNHPVGYVLLGESQFRSGQFDAAEATLGKEGVLNSSFPQVHFFLGNIAARKGQLDQAQDHYQKSIGVNGSYVPARIALSETFMAKGWLADARFQLRRVLELQPRNISARLLKAELDFVEKKYPEAEQELSTLVKEQPNNPLIHRQMGIHYEIRGQSAEAEKSLLRALEMAPNDEQSFRDLTSFYTKMRQADRAVQKLNSVPEDKKQAFHYEYLGIFAAQASKQQEAENLFLKALEKDPNRGSTQMLLFDTYVRNGRAEEGLKTFDVLLKRNPKNAGLYAVKGNLFHIQGKTKEAEDNYRLALQQDATNDIAANNLSYILAEEGRDLKAALGWARDARKRQPENPEFADTLAWVHYKLGNLVQARDEAEFAVSRQPGNGSFQYHLGVIYKGNKETVKAEAALKKALADANFREKSLADAILREISSSPLK